jgi:hypothetical protein
MRTCAIHVIWTTYMTWPPGDSRGHWSSLFDMYGRLIETGHKLNLPDPVTLKHAQDLAKEPPKILTPIEIDLVADVIGAHCPDSPQHAGGYVKIPGLRPIAGAIERTHTHLLLERTWTGGYWKVFIFEDNVVPIVANYIEQHNLRRNLPRAPYHWIRPIHPI